MFIGYDNDSPLSITIVIPSKNYPPMAFDLDELLLSAGFDPSVTDQHPDYTRSDDVPTNAIVFATELISPASASSSPPPSHPFTTLSAALVLTDRELLTCQASSLRGWTTELEKESLQVDSMADANIAAMANASAFEQRIHVWYCRLMALRDLPPENAMPTMRGMINLKKLWMNKEFSRSAAGLEQKDMCCVVDGCPQVAIHGSRYCAWHIMNDLEQRMFVDCPVCEKPVIASAEVHCEDEHQATRKK
jgi:hypothetical protein